MHTSSSPDVSKEDVEVFCNICVGLRSTFRHYQIIFEKGVELRRDLLQSVAPIFFGDLNRIFIEYLILQVCRLTDREETMGRRNLTVEFLLNNCHFPDGSSDLNTLKRLEDSLHAFRTEILPARNKFIGHLDRCSVHDDKALGATEKWTQFWLDLQEFLHILHKRYIDPAAVFYLNGIHSSDADSLVEVLEQSIR